MVKLEEFKVKMSKVEEKLKDKSMTSFLVVTVPTTLAVKESQRLVLELRKQGIAVSDVVVNQCVGKIGGALVESWMGSSLNQLCTHFAVQKTVLVMR